MENSIILLIFFLSSIIFFAIGFYLGKHLENSRIINFVNEMLREKE